MEPVIRRVHGWDEVSDQTVCGLDVADLPEGSVVEGIDWIDHHVRATYAVWTWCPDCERILSPDIHRCHCSLESLAEAWQEHLLQGWCSLVLRDVTEVVRSRTPEWCAPSIRVDASPEDGIVKLTVVWAEAR